MLPWSKSIMSTSMKIWLTKAQLSYLRIGQLERSLKLDHKTVVNTRWVLKAVLLSTKSLTEQLIATGVVKRKSTCRQRRKQLQKLQQQRQQQQRLNDWFIRKKLFDSPICYYLKTLYNCFNLYKVLVYWNFLKNLKTEYRFHFIIMNLIWTFSILSIACFWLNLSRLRKFTLFLLEWQSSEVICVFLVSE